MNKLIALFVPPPDPVSALCTSFWQHCSWLLLPFQHACLRAPSPAWQKELVRKWQSTLRIDQRGLDRQIQGQSAHLSMLLPSCQVCLSTEHCCFECRNQEGENQGAVLKWCW